MTRLAFVGKGGSGKTTLASLMVRYLGQQNITTFAIDADINQNLGTALGYAPSGLKLTPALGEHLKQLKTMLRGENVRFTPDTMVKTTLPGPSSAWLRLGEENPTLSYFTHQEMPYVQFIHVGGFDDTDLGVSCYHAKTGGAELVLNHLLDTPDQAVVVDMTAGADAFASGLFTRFDLTVMVVEPTLKSVGVYQQYKQYAQGYDVRIAVLGNKIETAADEAFVRQHCGEDMVAMIGRLAWVKAQEQGEQLPFTAIDPAAFEPLKTLWDEARNTQRDWIKYWQQGIHFHEKNALSWANQSVGCDVRDQIDKEWLLGEGFQTFISS